MPQAKEFTGALESSAVTMQPLIRAGEGAGGVDRLAQDGFLVAARADGHNALLNADKRISSGA